MRQEIRAILKCFIEQSETVASWGITQINISEDQLSFQVFGLKYQGKVCIKIFPPLYQITFLQSGYCDYLHLSEIVCVLDARIEKTATYLSDLNKWLNSI